MFNFEAENRKMEKKNYYICFQSNSLKYKGMGIYTQLCRRILRINCMLDGRKCPGWFIQSIPLKAYQTEWHCMHEGIINNYEADSIPLRRKYELRKKM